MKVTDRRLFEFIIKDSEGEVCGEVYEETVWFWLCFSIWKSFVNSEKINKGIFKYTCYSDINENN